MSRTSDDLAHAALQGVAQWKADHDHQVELKRRAEERLRETREVLRALYDFMPRGVCQSDYPDDCPVCRARELLTGVSQEERRRQIIAGPVCGAQDGTRGHVYGTCTRPAGHNNDWHCEMRDGKLWAEWRDPKNRRIEELPPVSET